jgi:O-antigen biosynthesis protein
MAIAKSWMLVEHVAAMAGHKTTATATAHYAKRRTAWRIRPRGVARPIAEDVAKVIMSPKVSRQTHLRTELLGLANRLKFAELLAAARADAVITHSDYEAEILRASLPKANVHRVRWSADPKPTSVQFNERKGLAFIGGFDHAPNVDAAKWLMSTLMPHIRREDPEIECYLVGSNFPAELEPMKPEGVVIVGQVADLSDIFDRVRVTIAPLGYGAGIKGKIVDSLAAGVPCVYTSVAGEGMGLPKELDACRGDDTETISEAVSKLHNDARLNRRCSLAGLKYVTEELSQQKLDLAMQQVVGRAIANGGIPQANPLAQNPVETG